MGRKIHKPEEIVAKLRQVDVYLAVIEAKRTARKACLLTWLRLLLLRIQIARGAPDQLQTA